MWVRIFHLIYYLLRKLFFKGLLDHQSFLLYFSFLASALIHAIRFPRWLCTLAASLHMYPLPVIFSSVNPACASSSVLSQHVLPFHHNDSRSFSRFFFPSASVQCLWSSQCESTCPFFDPSVFPGSVLTYLCCVGSQFTSFISLPKALFTSYTSPGSQL